MSLSPVPLYRIEKDVYIPLKQGHFVLKQLHVKENSSNPVIWIQRQLLALDLHCRGTCLKDVVIFVFSFFFFSGQWSQSQINPSHSSYFCVV